ncbi:MAG: hypothetical protein E6R07_00830 [Nevskiaceae bacterium]|nr:MAG: hypothetical protein E6R07_00830 [Nevskiaceae bacterium]
MLDGIDHRLNHYADRALGGVALLLVHETGALRGYWRDLGVRFAVARRARDAGELLRDQLDLLAESRRRMRHEGRVRSALWRGVWRDLTRTARAAG